MDDLNNDRIQGALDFFILNALSSEPLHDLAIERHIDQKTRGLFRRLKLSPGSFPAALQRLQQAGWIHADRHPTENSGSEKMYSLTVAGKEQLAGEWTRRRAELAEFIGGGTLDGSCRKFLDRNADLQH